ncbi:hypothetical protein VTN02DRAFT_2385 [Thermoascus thermophilus]
MRRLCQKGLVSTMESFCSLSLCLFLGRDGAHQQCSRWPGRRHRRVDRFEHLQHGQRHGESVVLRDPVTASPPILQGPFRGQRSTEHGQRQRLDQHLGRGLRLASGRIRRQRRHHPHLCLGRSDLVRVLSLPGCQLAVDGVYARRVCRAAHVWQAE